MVHPKVNIVNCLSFVSFFYERIVVDIVAVSLSNYRKIPKGSLLDEDSDSFDDDEWDKANKSWDSFEV